MTTANAPSELQLDALREVANVGCGQAANALSRLVGGRAVRIDVPRVLTIESGALPDTDAGDARVVAVGFDIQGTISGRMLLVWPEDDAAGLATLLGARGTGTLLEEPARSALSEVGNIVASACLSAIGTLARIRLIPSIPELSCDTASAILQRTVQEANAGDTSVVLEARFHMAPVPPLTGELFLVPARASLPTLFEALGL